MDMRQMQERIYQNILDKGFNTTNVEGKFCLLYGEVAEAFDAYKKKKDDLGLELADVAIYLMSIAEICGIDLEEQVIKKMEINEKRVYKRINGVLLKMESKEE